MKRATEEREATQIPSASIKAASSGKGSYTTVLLGLTHCSTSRRQVDSNRFLPAVPFLELVATSGRSDALISRT